MPKLLLEKPKSCTYLPEQLSKNLLFFESVMEEEDWDRYLQSGWRHFGDLFFRPYCFDCSACKAIRYSVAKFQLQKSQKRLLNKNKDLHWEVTSQLPEGAIEVLNAFQEERSVTRGWALETYSIDSLANEFFGSHSFVRCLSVFDSEQRLMGFSIIDVTQRSLNSIYCVYLPSEKHRSLGSFIALLEMEYAQQLQLRWVYLGLFNKDCLSLSYKAGYGDHQLREYSSLGKENGAWIPSLRIKK